jgi:hypothetical protein
MDAELKQALDDMERRLAERIRKSEDLSHVKELETKILTAFYEWAQTYEVRVRSNTRFIANLDERLGYIEERLARMERFSINPKAFQGVPYPPPAPSL